MLTKKTYRYSPIRVLIILSILSISLTNAFALSALANIPNTFLLLSFSLIISMKNTKLYFGKEHFILTLWTMLSIFSMRHLNSNTFTDIRGYLYVFIIFLICTNIFANSYLSKKEVLKYITISWLIAFGYGMLDFILANFTSILLDNYIYRYRAAIPLFENMRGLLPIGIFRMRSFFAEPGFYGFFLNMTTPFALYYQLKYEERKIVKYVFVLFIFFAYLLSFSTAGIIIAVFTFALITIIHSLNILKIRSNRYMYFNTKKLMLFFYGTLILIAIAIMWRAWIEDTYVGRLIIYRLFDSSSSSIRLERAFWGIDKVLIALKTDIMRFLFGHGIGYYYSVFKTTSISFLITLTVENGLIGLTLFLLFFTSLLRKIFRFNDPVKYYMLFSLVTACIHLSILPNYYFPHIWLILSYIWATIKASKNQSSGLL